MSEVEKVFHTSCRLPQSSGALCPYKQCKHMQIIENSKYPQVFKDVPKSHIVALSNEAELLFMFGI